MRHLTDGESPPASRSEISRFASSRTLIAVFSALCFLFFFSGLAIFSYAAFYSYRHFGFRSNFYDFDFPHFLLLSLLPFGFNAAFGAVFGMGFEREVCRLRKRLRENKPAALQRLRVFGRLSLVILWWAVFNLPALLQGEVEGKGLISPRHWPPESFYEPVARELFLFLQMGTLGLFFGFFAGCVRTELRAGRESKESLGDLGVLAASSEKKAHETHEKRENDG